MYVPPHALQQLYNHLQALSDKVLQQEKIMEAMRLELIELRKQRQIVVERIEYRFDQLKVETLEGTLNIGISPEPGKTIDELVMNSESHIMDADRARRFGELQADIMQRLDTDCLSIFQEFERDRQIILGEDYKRTVKAELRRQISDRLLHYMDKYDSPEYAGLEKPDAHITSCVMSDVHNALRDHLDSFKGKGGEPR